MKRTLLISFALIFIICNSSFSNFFIENRGQIQIKDLNVLYYSFYNDYQLYICQDKILIYDTEKDAISSIYEFKANGIENIRTTITPTYLNFYYKNFKAENVKTYSTLDFLDKQNNIKLRIEFTKDNLDIYSSDRSFSDYIINTEKKTSEKEKNKILSLGGILWSTYYGASSSDETNCSVYDKKTDNIYFGGFSRSSNYPVKNFPNKYSGSSDLTLTKFTINGDLLWATNMGSSSSDFIRTCVLDSNGNVWVAGEGYSSYDFPITSNAFQKNYGEGPSDGVIINFSSDGYVLYATFLGGNGNEALTNLCVDKYNTIWGVGRTDATDFPLTSNALKKSKNESFETPIYRFSIDGKLLYSSYFGGKSSGTLTLADAITTNQDGDIIIAGYTNSSSLPVSTNAYQKIKSGGWDSFIAKLNQNGKIAWCTYLGGTGSDYGSNITVDAYDNTYIQHYTNSTDLPIINSTLQINKSGNLDNYLTKFDKNGNLIWSTYFGGSGDEGQDFGAWQYIGGGLCITPKNNLAVFFKTTSPNLKTSTDAIQSNLSGNYDPYILLLDSNSNFHSGTYFGGPSAEYTANILAYNDSILIISGSTSSNNFPVKNPIQSTRKGESDQFMAVLGISTLPAPPPPPTDSIPPTIAGVQDSCSIFRTISVKDDQISTSGLKDINIIQSDNCDISITNKTQTTATILIRLIDYGKNGYYTIEIIDNAGNKTIIKDMLHSTESNYISFTPRPLYDFGKVKFGQTICRDIMIHNSSAKDVEINDIMIAKNLDFSIPQSQYP
ncbi:MAG: hypothetical protein ABFD00_06800, partial [Chloroherpetonaceae bacterium]